MKKLCIVLALLMVFALMAGCAQKTVSTDAGAAKADYSNETYVWANQLTAYPLFVNNDAVGLALASEELGIKTKIIGPQDIDVNQFIAAIEQEIASKPAGLMVTGWDVALNDPIKKAIAAGIPTIVIDGDLPDSGRLAYVGTDYYNMGVTYAKTLAPFLEGKKGKAAGIGLVGSDSDQSAFNGFVATMKTLNPDIEVLPELYSSGGDITKAAEIAKNLIQSNPDLIAIYGSDNVSGPGIAQAIKESGKQGQIYAVGVDYEPENIKPVEDKLLVATFGQKRVLFTYYATKLLFDYNHSKVNCLGKDREFGITNIPAKLDTGLFMITPDNVEKIKTALDERLVSLGKK
jgi:ABC-type sugar transport system substrate-binding protein